ncbi:alpha/beta hydrolase [Cupriavidus plantarum]|uniref:Acetyl esterase/lipase n=1 Tax=Cupriavidus plantarum TaxID=942865 RepID=A0A316EQV2_9BURK|nr:alpha/beta hydrolase [Cupriavidus plantarum]PWK34854.1 acetyl esterase/lipase [Cupriavidus plantarum]
MAGHIVADSVPVEVEDVTIEGHAKRIPLRVYAPGLRPDAGRPAAALRPIVVYLHGGGFLHGNLDAGDAAARAIALATPAVVVSVGYSLPPAYPFPAPLEDGYLACRWAREHARRLRADADCLGVAGHDAGGNLAAGIGAMARDRKEIPVRAQALLAPLLDPSLTRVSHLIECPSGEMSVTACAHGYRAYLPGFRQLLHPYAAPLESRRLAGLPPTLIISAALDLLHLEAEAYAGALIAAGVPTQMLRIPDVSHAALAANAQALAEVSAFFAKQLSPRTKGGKT